MNLLKRLQRLTEDINYCDLYRKIIVQIESGKKEGVVDTTTWKLTTSLDDIWEQMSSEITNRVLVAIANNIQNKNYNDNIISGGGIAISFDTAITNFVSEKYNIPIDRLTDNNHWNVVNLPFEYELRIDEYATLPDDFNESLEDGDFEFKDLVRRIPPRIRNGKLNGTLKSVRWTTTTNLDDIWDKIPDQYKKIICRTMSRYIGSALKQIADDDGWEFTQKNGFGIHTCWGEDELKKLGIKEYDIDYRGGSCIHVRYEFHIEKFGGLPDLDESINNFSSFKHKVSDDIQKGKRSGGRGNTTWKLITSADSFWDNIPDDLKSEILERISWNCWSDHSYEHDTDRNYGSFELNGVAGVQFELWTDYTIEDILKMGFSDEDIKFYGDNEDSLEVKYKVTIDEYGALPDDFNESEG